MRLPKSKARIVLDAVDSLREERVIDEATAESIRRNVEPVSFDWRRLARYAFVAAICCVVISILSAVFDEAIIRWCERLLPYLKRLFNAPPPVRAAALFAFSAVLFWLGSRRRAKLPANIYSNEAVFMLGVLAIAGGVFSLSQMPELTGMGTWLTSVTGVVYLLLGVALESKFVWCFGLLTLSGALGNGTGYELGGYYLWESTPVVSLGYGMVLVSVAAFLRWSMKAVKPESAGLLPRVAPLWGVTRVFGLLHLFISLWILSIWGTGDGGYGAGHFRWDCLVWTLLFGAAAVVTVARSLETDDAVLRGFGLTFFFINLYTALFDYFWDSLHKAFFFAILAVSFWLIGRKAEAIWNLSAFRKAELKPPTSGEG